MANDISAEASGPSTDWRRWTLLVLTLCLFAGGAGLWLSGDDNLWHMLLRPALAFGCLWLAWPTVRRPANWLPPGIAVATLLLIGAVAARPRLLVVLVPLAGVVGTLAAVIRLIRGPSR